MVEQQTRRLRRPRREDVFAGIVVLIAVVCVIALGSIFLIEKEFQPRDGLFGIPTRIPACGRTYDVGRQFTRAQIYAGINPGSEPIVFEPLIGLIPLTAPFEGHQVRLASGEMVCDTVVFLHVGPDGYVGYGLEGGP